MARPPVLRRPKPLSAMAPRALSFGVFLVVVAGIFGFIDDEKARLKRSQGKGAGRAMDLDTMLAPEDVMRNVGQGQSQQGMYDSERTAEYHARMLKITREFLAEHARQQAEAAETGAPPPRPGMPPKGWRSGN
eukprot:RCo006093